MWAWRRDWGGAEVRRVPPCLDQGVHRGQPSGARSRQGSIHEEPEGTPYPPLSRKAFNQVKLPAAGTEALGSGEEQRC